MGEFSIRIWGNSWDSERIMRSEGGNWKKEVARLGRSRLGKEGLTGEWVGGIVLWEQRECF